MGREFQSVPGSEPGKFYSTAMGDRAMGLNIALGDLDEKESGAGNFGTLPPRGLVCRSKRPPHQVRQWGTLWIIAGAKTGRKRNRRPAADTYETLAKMIDHSLLRPELTEEEVVEGCRVAA